MNEWFEGSLYGTLSIKHLRLNYLNRTRPAEAAASSAYEEEDVRYIGSNFGLETTKSSQKVLSFPLSPARVSMKVRPDAFRSKGTKFTSAIRLPPLRSRFCLSDISFSTFWKVNCSCGNEAGPFVSRRTDEVTNCLGAETFLKRIVKCAIKLRRAPNKTGYLRHWNWPLKRPTALIALQEPLDNIFLKQRDTKYLPSLFFKPESSITKSFGHTIVNQPHSHSWSMVFGGIPRT